MSEAFTALDDHLPVAFRQANVEDAASVAMLLNDLGYVLSLAKVRQTLQILLREQAMQVVLAVSPADEVVGLMTLHRFPALRLGGLQVSIEELVVAERHRGCGIGRQLIQHAVAFARRLGAVRLEVCSSLGRESSRRGFYLKNGFQVADSRIYRYHMQQGTEHEAS